MPDELEELLSLIILTEGQILSIVDEFHLLSHYLTFPVELRKAYSSPFRADDRPSFSVYESTRESLSICEYRWKDSALNVSGDVFELVKRLYNLTSKEQALYQIDKDFELGLATGNPIKHVENVYQKPISKTSSKISIKSKTYSNQARRFWSEYGISEVILRLYEVVEIQCFWTSDAQTAPFTPKGLCFSYQINGYYKLYQPFSQDFKFINNYPENYVEGFLQLPATGDLLIITKSLKDTMVLASLGYSSCSPKSESTPFPQHLLEQLKSRFKRIVFFFDNDVLAEQNWGRLNVEKFYPAYEHIYIPNAIAETRIKDVSDYRKVFNEPQTRQLLIQLLYEKSKDTTDFCRR